VGGTATLAQINAGLTIIPARANGTITPLRAILKVNGTFSALTDLRLSDTADTPVDWMTRLAAQVTAGRVFFENAGGSFIEHVNGQALLADINSGIAIVPAISGITYTPLRFRLVPNGSFAALTDIRLSDTASSPVDIVTIAQAEAGSGVIHSDSSGTNTIGAGFLAPLTADKGIQIRKTGSSGTTATGLYYSVLYQKVKELASLTAGKGLQIRKTGSTATGGTSVDYSIEYTLAVR